MKQKKSILFCIIASFIYLCISAYSTGLKDYTTNCSSCHGLASGKTFCSLQLTEKSTGITVTDGRYKPNTLYYLSLNGYNKDSNTKFGYRIVITNKDSTNAGILTTSDTANTFIESTTPIIIAGHTKINIASVAGIFKVDFVWLSPTAGAKNIHFQSIINSVNADNSSSGDFLSEEIIEKFEEEIDAKITEREPLKLSLFPNPTNGILTINYPKIDKFVINISDISGIKQLTVHNRREIDVSALTNGVYLIQLNTEKIQQTATFVKQ